MSIFGKLFGDPNKRIIKNYEGIVRRINELESKFERFSVEELRAKTDELKKLVVYGESLDVVLPEAFAAVREAAKRTLGQRHFDVQLMGGIALHQGKIAEMKTGEGKTLVATLPAYLNALTGRGVHIVTVNDYLSRRDVAWMGQVYHLLGLTVGCINHDISYIYDPLHSDSKIQNDNLKFKSEKNENEPRSLDQTRDTEGSYRVVHEFLRPVTRREAYEADITYGTNNEFGFDYLRDNMAYSLDQQVQTRGLTRTVNGPTRTNSENSAIVRVESALVRDSVIHNYAIVDEVDSILIDEARTPLIISAPDSDSTKLYETFARIVPRLKENEDYNVDEKLRAVSITEAGIEKVEKTLNLKNIYEEGGTRYVHHLEQALKAHVLFHKDKDYVVRDGQIVIVDEFTGRLMPGRRWSEGLHQAVEAKEGVYVQKESRTMATITFQNYFRLYQKLAGMTGTAQTSAEEFHKVYNIDVVTIPTNKPMIREDRTDRIYKTEAGKLRALVAEIKERHLTGQPVLVGTASINKNELVSAMLDREGVPHKVLNAKNHEQEGAVIAQAGQLGAVTIATNMAGRGVDIMLGGVAPSKISNFQPSTRAEHGAGPVPHRNEVSGAGFPISNEENDEYKRWEEENRRIKELGGLHVIGTERHEARRIDNQLRGRAGRQGDPGSSQFFVSTEDEVIRIFGGDRLKNLMDTLGVGEDDVIENRFISRAIEQAQSKIEGHNFDIRKHVLEYDDVMNRHRTAIYKLRREVLESNNPTRGRLAGETTVAVGQLTSNGTREKVLGYVHDLIDKVVRTHTVAEGGSWNTEEMAENMNALIGAEDNLHGKLKEFADSLDASGLLEYMHQLADTAYIKKESEVGVGAMRHLEKMLLLRVIDELWVDHLEQMEYLRDSVRLRAYGQRDPLVEYKIEGQKMFVQLQEIIGVQVASLVFKVGLVYQPQKSSMIENHKEVTQIPNSKFQAPDNIQFQNSNGQIKKGIGDDKSPRNIGRNDPCWCGSGKKYKRCHGA